MDFETYVKCLLCKVQLFMGESYDVEITKVSKNNGVMLTGLMAKKTGQNMCPTLYIDDYYSLDISESDIEYIAMSISKSLKNSKYPPEDIVEEISDFDKVKRRIYLKLINAEKNKKLLIDCPHKRIFNLALVYFIYGESDEYGLSSVLIKNDFLEMWNVDENDLYEAGMKNQKENRRPVVHNIKDLLEMLSVSYSNELDDSCDYKMYVMTTPDKFFGAAGLVLTDELVDFSEKIDNSFYILPSSIHELVLIPDTGEMNPKEMADQVEMINRTEVSPEEVLSDSIYYFDRVTKEVTWVCQLPVKFA